MAEKMMKPVFIVLLCVSIAYCAQSIERVPASDKEKAEGFACKSSDKSIGLLKAGESRQNYVPGLCGEVSCGRNGTITYTTCGAIMLEDCVLVENSSKPYPDCCMDFKCK